MLILLLAVAMVAADSTSSSGDKRRQFISPLPGQAQTPRNYLPPAPIAYPAFAQPPPGYLPAPTVLAPPPPPPVHPVYTYAAAPVAPAPAAAQPLGQCPGGPSLPIECDPKRPWPACPPQSYCYATNSVDIGPYFCCPVWSTYGAAWRPAAPFFNYVPPIPANWPDVHKLTANWPATAVGLPVAAAPAPLPYAAAAAGYPIPFSSFKRKNQPQTFQQDDDATVDNTRDQSKIDASIQNWMMRQASSA